MFTIIAWGGSIESISGFEPINFCNVLILMFRNLDEFFVCAFILCPPSNSNLKENREG